MWDTAYLQIKVGGAARGIENKKKLLSNDVTTATIVCLTQLRQLDLF